MYVNLAIAPRTIKEPTIYSSDILNNQNPFPIMCIYIDSYIVGAKLESSLNYHVTAGIHNLQIGKYSLLAEEILFLIDVDKDYKHICMGAISAFDGLKYKRKINRTRKGQIIIQNDCWIGSGAAIMGGVTIHNGAIVTAKAVVTKDVPPYAIVGGNPARVIKYRFDEQQIIALQKIAWWDWNQEKIRDNAGLFYGDVSDFISSHLAEAESRLGRVSELNRDKSGNPAVTYLFIPDLYEPYPSYEKVIDEFVKFANGKNIQMLIFLKPDERIAESKSIIGNVLDKHKECHFLIDICDENVEDERSLFKAADYYITTRAKENVQRMCFASLCGAKCISGVDMPVFF